MSKKFEDGPYSFLWKLDHADGKENYPVLTDWSAVQNINITMIICYHLIDLEFMRQIFEQTLSLRYWVCHFSRLLLWIQVPSANSGYFIG